MRAEAYVSEQLHHVPSSLSVRSAAERMNELRIGSLVVIDEGRICGILTSRDIRAANPNRIVADAMTRDPIVIAKSAFIGTALAVMKQAAIERLIVVDGDRPIGIVTRESLLAEIGKFTDQMTGLYRSGYIEFAFQHLIGQAVRFHLLFIDLNNFGLVNKKYGHPVGDEILVHYASLLKKLAREDDYLCRYGGDEFVMITARDGVEPLISELGETVEWQDIAVSAAIGHVNGFETDLSRSTYREAISLASRRSTGAKKRRSAAGRAAATGGDLDRAPTGAGSTRKATPPTGGSRRETKVTDG